MKVSKEAMKDMYLRMVRIREFESKAQSLFADGKIPGFVHLYLGEALDLNIKNRFLMIAL